MRLIDADKLMLSLNDNYLANSPTGNETLAVQDYRESMCEGLEIAMATVEGAPTVGGWISVKDKLPKSMINKVLVWLNHEDLNGYIGYGHYEKFHGEEMWYDLEHDERFDKRGYIVTHWMPLPEPPK